MLGNKLANAYFDLKDESGHLIGSFISDATGKVTTAYLRPNADYTLAETKSPKYFHGLDNPLTIRQNTDGTVSVTCGSTLDAERVVVDNTDPDNPVVTVKNIKYDFSITKKDKNTKDPIQGVKFELHKQRTVGGVTVIDFNPIPGYENLLTDANGIVPLIDSNLPAGTYQLREVETPITHHSLNYYVTFTVSETGEIKINTVHPEIELQTERKTEAGEEKLYYTLLIYNIPISDDFTITKEVAGNMGNKTEEFPVTVTFATPSNQPYVGTFYTETNGGTPKEWTLTAADNGQLTFNIMHGDRVVFTGLDDGTKFTVQEDYKDYKPTAYINHILIGETGTVTGNITDDRIIKFVNTREGVIPTGLETSFNLSVSILCALTSGVVASRLFFMRRRREEEEEG